MGAGAAGSGVVILADNMLKRAKMQELKDEMESLKLEQERNFVGDCLNEGILKGAFGVPQSTLIECKEERKIWHDQYYEPESKEQLSK